MSAQLSMINIEFYVAYSH